MLDQPYPPTEALISRGLASGGRGNCRNQGAGQVSEGCGTSCIIVVSQESYDSPKSQAHTLSFYLWEMHWSLEMLRQSQEWLYIPRMQDAAEGRLMEMLCCMRRCIQGSSVLLPVGVPIFT